MTPDPWLALGLSVQVGLWCVVLGLPLAVGLGWVLARWDFPGKALLQGAVLVPMVLPPVVTGLLLMDALGRSTWLGGLLERAGLPLSFSFAGAVLAAMAVGLPLYVWSARAAFEAVDPRYEEVVLTVGHSPLRAFWTVSLPLALPGIAGGAVLAFARALGEFGATAVLAGNMEGETRTLALAVYTLLDVPDGEAAMRPLMLASLAVAGASLVGYEALSRWQRRRLELDRARP